MLSGHGKNVSRISRWLWGWLGTPTTREAGGEDQTWQNMTGHDPKCPEWWMLISSWCFVCVSPQKQLGKRKDVITLWVFFFDLAQSKSFQRDTSSFEAAQQARCVVPSAAVVVAVPAWVVVAWVWCSASSWWVVSSWQLRILYWSGSQHTRRRFKKWGHASMQQHLKSMRLWLTNCQLSVGICFVTNAMVTSSCPLSDVFFCLFFQRKNPLTLDRCLDRMII